MSFRSRLTAFFLLIVVVPMAALAFLLVRTNDQLTAARADAAAEQALRSSASLYREEQKRAREELSLLAQDPVLRQHWSSDRPQLLKRFLRSLLDSASVSRIVALDEKGEVIFSLGNPTGIATVRLEAAGGESSTRSILVSGIDPEGFARRVAEISGQTVFIADDELLASSGPAFKDPPEDGGIEIDGAPYRISSMTLDEGGEEVRIGVAVTSNPRSIFANQPGLALVLGALLLLATALTLVLRRGMQEQIEAMLEAAKAIGQGEFDVSVPVNGSDELAELGREFNAMGASLSRQLDAIESQRNELESVVLRLGEAFASGLDRKALMELSLSTALEACRAEAGEIVSGTYGGIRSGADQAGEILAEAAKRATSGRSVSFSSGQWWAMAEPLLSEEATVRGSLAIARASGPFTETERELIQYLGAQATISLDNVALHERLADQAITDELTGLANHRRFQELLAHETQRAERFDRSLSLLFIDLDDFKQVNDKYGHPAGDIALKQISQILRREARASDTAARYGGEELAVLSPESGLQGAVELAERIRVLVEAAHQADERLPTISIGVACFPEHAASAQDLIGAADKALYRAKQSGKNRVEVAVTSS